MSEQHVRGSIRAHELFSVPPFKRSPISDLRARMFGSSFRALEIDADAWGTLHSDTSRLFERPASGRVAVTVINHLGDEVMRVFRV